MGPVWPAEDVATWARERETAPTALIEPRATRQVPRSPGGLLGFGTCRRELRPCTQGLRGASRRPRQSSWDCQWADDRLDAAFPALFLALLVPQLRAPRALPTALIAAGVALVLIPFTPAGIPIIAASAACLLGWRRE